MLIAEELLLQATLPDGRVTSPASSGLDLGLAGALLSELALLERVTLTPNGRLLTQSRAPIGQPTLDAALAVFDQHQGKKPSKVLGKVAKGLRQQLYSGLAAAGEVRPQEAKRFGIFPTTHWVPDPHGRREQTRDAVAQVLLGTAAADARSGSITSLLLAIGAIPSLFEGLGALSGRELTRRAKVISEGNWAGAAVSKAVAEVQAAVNAAIIGAVVASTASAGASSS
ncbi:GOLPH3/VPS74 family protein [Knoellia subterranea]|uniref:GPP34 family phosphoprotein n=1 Tax=Knoellia subterranea KCTC 19937 TaxID=1385521 RepID=A0A0A0JNW0_9MICO|nr:GPP34 family phosphoprotein [Knoellia subterranea]KGN37306.1 hypothetical protein N803_15440 [Knoellia subterranea KCTC 19937]